MTTGEVLYLALVIVAFLAFSGTLFVAMTRSGGNMPAEDGAHHHHPSHH